MPVVRSSLRSYEARKKKRARSLTSRARSAKPTARNQKRQIVSLSRRVAKNTSLLRQQRIYTDYQWGQTEQRGMFLSPHSGVWAGWRLTDLAQWVPVLRQDMNVITSSKTFALRMQLNLRANIGTVQNQCFFNVFLVTCRKDSADALDIQDFIGGMHPLVHNIDFIDHSENETANVRLNSGKYKVHACKYFTLMPNTGEGPIPADASAGQPSALWRKWQWNVPLKFSFRNPANHDWKSLSWEHLAYYQKYYLLVYTGSLPDSGYPKFYCDALATCINYF